MNILEWIGIGTLAAGIYFALVFTFTCNDDIDT